MPANPPGGKKIFGMSRGTAAVVGIGGLGVSVFLYLHYRKQQEAAAAASAAAAKSASSYGYGSGPPPGYYGYGGWFGNPNPFPFGYGTPPPPPANQVTVPDVIGMNRVNSKATLAQAGLVYKQANIIRGTAHATVETPAAGAQVNPGSTVVVTMAPGPPTVN